MPEGTGAVLLARLQRRLGALAGARRGDDGDGGGVEAKWALLWSSDALASAHATRPPGSCSTSPLHLHGRHGAAAGFPASALLSALARTLTLTRAPAEAAMHPPAASHGEPRTTPGQCAQGAVPRTHHLACRPPLHHGHARLAGPTARRVCLCASVPAPPCLAPCSRALHGALP